LAEDRTLSRLFLEIQRQVPGGLAQTLIVLTADHGVSPAPSVLKETRIENGRINGKKLLAELNAKLTERFGSVSTGEGWLIYQTELNFFLNHASIAEKKKNRVELEDAVKAELLKVPGAAFVFTRTEVERRILPPGHVERGILLQYHPGRSGDVVLVPKPFYSQDTDPVVHMTHYAYDRQVPLLFYGAPFKSGVRHAEAQVQDLAPTLAYVLGIVAPAASEGKVLFPALQ
jgi:arylsulfatase A-like enzyme